MVTSVCAWLDFGLAAGSGRASVPVLVRGVVRCRRLPCRTSGRDFCVSASVRNYLREKARRKVVRAGLALPGCIINGVAIPRGGPREKISELACGVSLDARGPAG